MTELDDLGPDGLSAIERVVARDEIRQLVYRYALVLEQRDIGALAALFAPGADFGDHGRGPEGARRLFGDNLAGLGMAVLLVGNHLIDFTDRHHARGVVWSRGYIDDPDEGFIEQMIQYRDRYEVVDGHWRFTGRRHELWYGVATAEQPLAQAEANWPDRQVGRGTLLGDA